MLEFIQSIIGGAILIIVCYFVYVEVYVELWSRWIQPTMAKEWARTGMEERRLSRMGLRVLLPVKKVPWLFNNPWLYYDFDVVEDDSMPIVCLPRARGGYTVLWSMARLAEGYDYDKYRMIPEVINPKEGDIYLSFDTDSTERIWEIIRTISNDY